MKNLIIGALVIVVMILGYLLFININDADAPSSENNQNSSQQSNASNGKTVDLSGQGLENVPMSTFEDKSAVVLNVSNNNLTGALPAEIRKMSNLEQLIANDNNLTGIPAEIGQLSKLKIANFANNGISGLPLEIGNLSNLETLDLRGNPNISQFDLEQIQPKIPNAQILTD